MSLCDGLVLVCACVCVAACDGVGACVCVFASLINGRTGDGSHFSSIGEGWGGGGINCSYCGRLNELVEITFIMNFWLYIIL